MPTAVIVGIAFYQRNGQKVLRRFTHIWLLAEMAYYRIRLATSLSGGKIKQLIGELVDFHIFLGDEPGLCGQSENTGLL